MVNRADKYGQTDRQTDRQTNSKAPYTGVCGFFLSVKFATSLLASLAGGLAIVWLLVFTKIELQISFSTGSLKKVVL